MYVSSLLRMPLQTSRFLAYKKFGATSFASVRISAAQQIFWFADPEAVQIVASDRHTFQKDIASYEVINFYGVNVISVEGSDWKRHRSIAMSAFNEASTYPIYHYLSNLGTRQTLRWSGRKLCV